MPVGFGGLVMPPLRGESETPFVVRVSEIRVKLAHLPKRCGGFLVPAESSQSPREVIVCLDIVRLQPQCNPKGTDSVFEPSLAHEI